MLSDYSVDLETLRQNVVKKRREIGFNLRELGMLLDVAFSTIAQFERGQTLNLSYTVRKKFEAWLAGEDPLHVIRNHILPITTEITIPVLDAIVSRVIEREIRKVLTPYLEALTALTVGSSS